MTGNIALNKISQHTTNTAIIPAGLCSSLHITFLVTNERGMLDVHVNDIQDLYFL